MSRKLDAAIAEALGYEVDVSMSKHSWYYMVKRKACGVIRMKEIIPHYSTNGNDMLGLDREMRERGFLIMVEAPNDGGYAASYFKVYREAWTGDFLASSMPKATALAAYYALTRKEWNGE